MWCVILAALVAGESLRLRGRQVPPEFWMWKTTPAPPMVPGPNPQLLWVEQTAPGLPTTAPPLEACYGCDCLFVDVGDFIVGGKLNNKYTCAGGPATALSPHFTWAGVPQNSGVGHVVAQANGKQCIKSQSFAIVVEDLDYPNGIGQKGNRVFTHYWAVNIPGDATELTDALIASTINGEKIVTVGMNDAGTIGMDPPCPEFGVHRIRTTLWALSTTVGSEVEPIKPEQGWPAIRAILEPMELARTSFYGTVKAGAWDPALHGSGAVLAAAKKHQKDTRATTL